MWGEGYLIGIALAFLFWFFVLRSVDKTYYKRKAEILRKRKLKLKESRREASHSSGKSSINKRIM